MDIGMRMHAIVRRGSVLEFVLACRVAATSLISYLQSFSVPI